VTPAQVVHALTAPPSWNPNGADTVIVPPLKSFTALALNTAAP
jgi:hypothetical protein